MGYEPADLVIAALWSIAVGFSVGLVLGLLARVAERG